MPVSSGGSYPGRAVLMLSSRFLYVLNQGGSDCTTNPADTDCEKANIVQFSIGGNGILVPQQTFYTQGKNPFRIIADTSGQHIYVLDHDAPDNSSCALALGASFTTCGDITGFTVESSTGRLSLMTNAQVSSSNGTPLTYFPVPSNSIDMLFSGSYMFILSGTPDTGDFVFPYAYANGQLTVSQNSIQQIGTTQATAITTGNSFIYILDNEPITIPADTTGPFNPGVYPTQILPWTVGAGGGLQAATGGTVPGVANETNPMFLLATTKAVYVANQGDIVNFNSGQHAERHCGLRDRHLDPSADADVQQPLRLRQRPDLPGGRPVEPVRLHGQLQRLQRNRPLARSEHRRAPRPAGQCEQGLSAQRPGVLLPD